MKSCMVAGCGVVQGAGEMPRLDSQKRIRRAVAGALLSSIGAALLFGPWPVRIGAVVSCTVMVCRFVALLPHAS